MHIHIKKDVISIRIYDDGLSYHNKDRYSGIITGYVISDSEIHLVGAHGDIGSKAIRMIRDELNSMGYKKLTFERQGKIKHVEL
ncbi:MAG: hypothetical protein GY694_14575 [Gammaproteobacteria bacterium]|nr:hypothetical protein [Gammaproteobacteria bacterium]